MHTPSRHVTTEPSMCLLADYSHTSLNLRAGPHQVMSAAHRLIQEHATRHGISTGDANAFFTTVQANAVRAGAFIVLCVRGPMGGGFACGR